MVADFLFCASGYGGLVAKSRNRALPWRVGGSRGGDRASPRSPRPSWSYAWNEIIENVAISLYSWNLYLSFLKISLDLLSK